MMKKALAVLGVIALLGTAAEAQRAGRTARAGRVGGRSGVPSTVNVQGSLTSVSATVADTTATTSVDCTKPAPVTDAQANRVCALAVQQALDVLDKSKRKNATVAYANIELAGKTVSVTDGVTPATCNVEPYCANFIETNVNKMWDTYDAYAQNDQKQCNIMLARMFAAEDCYRYVLTNNTMDGFTAIGGRKVEGCSNADIWSHYQKLDPFETDTTVADDGNIEKYFEKVGGIGLSNLLAYPARIVDLKIDFTTAEFPRELVQLVNSMHNNANAMCGADRFTALYDANFPINYDAKQTSLERQVAEKGLLLGGKQWGVNQIGAVMGTNWADEAMAGKTREEKNKKNLADGDFCHVNVSAETLDYNAIFDELDKSAGSGGFGCFNIDQAGTSNISYMLVTNSTQYTVLKYTSSRGKISGVKIKDTPVDVVYIELESDFVNKKDEYRISDKNKQLINGRSYQSIEIPPEKGGTVYYCTELGRWVLKNYIDTTNNKINAADYSSHDKACMKTGKSAPPSNEKKTAGTSEMMTTREKNEALLDIDSIIKNIDEALIELPESEEKTGFETRLTPLKEKREAYRGMDEDGTEKISTLTRTNATQLKDDVDTLAKNIQDFQRTQPPPPGTE